MRTPQVIWERTICAVALSLSLGTCAWAQQAPIVPAAETTRQGAMPRSGALVALSNGQTVWIAPVNGKMHAIAADDYVIPRKDGFWRVRLEIKGGDPMDSQSADSAAGDSARVERGLLWAVRLNKGKDAVPWPPAPPPKPEDNTKEQDENSADLMESAREDAEKTLEQELNFLGPDYLSYNQTQDVISSGGGTGTSDLYFILKIKDAPAMKKGGTQGLMVESENPPITPEVRAKDLNACIDPTDKDDFKDEDFLRDAEEVTYGIQRSRGKWTYAWLLGYSMGAARGFHAECDVSVLPPKSMVGYDQMFPGWDAIKDAYPDAEDPFSSPTHDMVLIIYGNRLIVAPLIDGKVGKSLARLEINGKPVMVQWATGKYVDKWTHDLAPFFQPYVPAPAKIEN